MVNHELTRCEREVMALIVEGLTDRQIGERLNRKPRSVRWHLSNAAQKFGTSGRIATAVAFDRAERANQGVSANG